MMRIEGLYAITPDRASCDSTRLLEITTLALAGGARVLQYRRKDISMQQRMEEARALREICRDYGAVFIINDDIELAHAVSADGVHLGRDDGSVSAARSRLGNAAIIGASCYNEFDRAQTMVEAGASYVAFGSFYPSAIKPNAARPTLELLLRARAELPCPIVAIGGITRNNASALITAGAHAVAVISDLFSVPDVRASAAAFAALFASGTPSLVKASTS